MRVVFDSNVLLAALLFPEGRAAAAVENILDGSDDLVLSPPILREILSVLSRKFSRDREELSRVAVVLGEMGEIVDPSRRHLVYEPEIVEARSAQDQPGPLFLQGPKMFDNGGSLASQLDAVGV